MNTIDSNKVMNLRLLQFKLYLKILDIPYFNEIFVSKPYVIKVSPKSNMAII